ncbi:MAG: sigma-70 family RNA polymerase sigma factor [Flavobacteriaceae bacterium]|nr:sigma-70 family RNA polymerase sigma factor [Flavobacteriaceae bacterium]
MNQPDELIIKMQQGSESAFASIYQLYSKAIHGVIIPVVRDQEIAEEILQDVFVKVWNNANSYNINKGRFYTWLLNIARNAAIDKTRSKAFKNSQKNLTTDNFVHILEGPDNLSGKLDAIGLQRFIDNLKPICIQLIDLLYFKGFTQAETAKELDSPLGTIKTRARNCINELRKIVVRT